MLTWDELRHRHAGETGLVIGNGPGLRNIPISFLRKYPSIGTNRIYLMDHFTPTYYIAVNPWVIKQFLPDIKKLECEAKFIRSEYAHAVHGSLQLNSYSMLSFSKMPNEWIHEGFTVTYVSLQLAYFMGFKRVLLVGVDHKYTYTGNPNEENVLEIDNNHFDERYFAHAWWNNPDLHRSEQAYRLARETYERSGCEVINCSDPTELTVFPLDDWRNYV